MAMERTRWQLDWILLAVVLALATGLNANANARNGKVRYRRALGNVRKTFNVSITEEQAAGTQVVNLQVASGLPRGGRYTLLGDTSDLFELNATTGILYTKVPIDRDGLCDEEGAHNWACCRAVDRGRTSPCMLEPTVMVEMMGAQQQMQLAVTVRDLNDNSPVFSADPSTLSIKENVRNLDVPLPVATDRDAEAFDVQEYRLISNYSNMFELRCNPEEPRAQRPASVACRRNERLAQTPLRPVLHVRAPADRERQDSYELLLVALDGGLPPLSASVTVHVLVTDVNDHPPSFAQNSYTFNVSESEPIGFEVGNVIATDNDTDKNAEIEYRIFSTHSRAEEIFSIDQGVLRLNNQLDYDGIQQQYRFAIVASDGGQQSASTSVTVNVLDANDNQPRVEVHLLDQNTEKLVVVENESKSERILGMVRVYDGDSDREGRNNNVTCSTDSVYFKLVSLSSQPGLKRYAIHSQRPLDREESDSLDLMIACTDNGSPPMTAQTLVKVEVQDVNDNAPILQGTSVFEILENSPPQTSIGFVNASDADQAGTANSTVVYRLTNEADAQFVWLDAHTGELRAVRRFDREEQAMYRFNVTVSDRGPSPLNATYQLTLLVQDVNDNAPQLRPGATSFAVREDLVSNSPVGRLEADDRDEAGTDNSRVRFRLIRGDDFFILTDAGDLFTRTALDREQHASHLLIVNLTNYATFGTAPSSTATVRIDVLDVKDSPPRFLAHPHPVSNVSCYETRPVELARLTAVDDDENDTLTYAILHGNPDGHFFVDPHTGSVRLVTTNWRCEPETLSLQKLTVVATDSVGRSSSTTLSVLITNDSGPKALPAEHGLLASEAVKVVIVLVCASLVLATALIVVVLVFKVRPRRTARYLHAAPADDPTYTKRPDLPMPPSVRDADDLSEPEADLDPDPSTDLHTHVHAEQLSDASSEDRYAAVLDDNNNSGHGLDVPHELPRPVELSSEKPVPDYDSVRGNRDSASRCSSLMADTRSTLTRAADRELLYHSHARHQPPPRPRPPEPPLDSHCACSCAECLALYASDPYAATLGRPVPPTPSDDAGHPRRPDHRTLPRRLTSTVSSKTTYQPHGSPYLTARHKRPDGQSVYGDLLYCTTCDALNCRDGRMQHCTLLPTPADTVVQLSPGPPDRLYGTHVQARRTSSKGLTTKTAAVPSASKSAFNQPAADRSLTYVTPNKLTLKAKDATYGEHAKSSPYYSVSYV